MAVAVAAGVAVGVDAGDAVGVATGVEVGDAVGVALGVAVGAAVGVGRRVAAAVAKGSTRMLTWALSPFWQATKAAAAPISRPTEASLAHGKIISRAILPHDGAFRTLGPPALQPPTSDLI